MNRVKHEKSEWIILVKLLENGSYKLKLLFSGWITQRFIHICSSGPLSSGRRELSLEDR